MKKFVKLILVLFLMSLAFTSCEFINGKDTNTYTETTPNIPTDSASDLVFAVCEGGYMVVEIKPDADKNVVIPDTVGG